MRFKMVFLIFIIWRLADFLVLFLAPRFIPYLGFFPYKEILTSYHLPEFITKLANFDGVHYLLIARQGYMQYEQAFFPLYPVLIKILTPIFLSNSLLAALLISNILFLLGIFLLIICLKTGGEQRGAPTKRATTPHQTVRGVRASEDGAVARQAPFWIMVFLLAFPTSFFFGAVYTEGLFFFLFIASLYFLKNKNYFWAGVFAFLTSLTKLIGIFLIIPFLLHRHPTVDRSGRKTGWHKALIFTPLLGFLVYTIYLYQTTGDPFFFFSSQPIFGAHRSTSLVLLPQVYWRYIKIFFTAQHDFRYFVSLFEFIVFTSIFVILILELINLLKNRNLTYTKRSLPIGIWLFSFINLVLPSLTGTFSSIPRYALLSLSTFIFLGQIKQRWIKVLIAVVFLIFHVVVLGFFAQGYFIG